MAVPVVVGAAPCAPRRPRPRRSGGGRPLLRKRVVGALLQRRASRRFEELAEERDVRIRPTCLPTHAGGNEHQWVSFWRDCDATLRGTDQKGSGCFSRSQNLTNVRSPREVNWAHNTALLWDVGAVHALGGRDNPAHHRLYAGVRTAPRPSTTRLSSHAASTEI